MNKPNSKDSNLIEQSWYVAEYSMLLLQANAFSQKITDLLSQTELNTLVISQIAAMI